MKNAQLILKPTMKKLIVVVSVLIGVAMLVLTRLLAMDPIFPLFVLILSGLMAWGFLFIGWYEWIREGITYSKGNKRFTAWACMACLCGAYLIALNSISYHWAVALLAVAGAYWSVRRCIRISRT